MMAQFLLDTHALIWWWLADPKLSVAAREAIEGEGSRIVVSAVSIYEIANKQRVGKLPALQAILAELDDAVADSGFEQLPLTSRHAVHAGLLLGDHRDPFDRMIAAQGLVERLTVITRDPEIAGFGCKVLW
jgi:PIN domain nuclease of toxin-antitoxin system